MTDEITIQVQIGNVTFGFKTDYSGTGLPEAVKSIQTIIKMHGDALLSIQSKKLDVERPERKVSVHRPAAIEELSLANLSIPDDIKDAFVDHKDNLSNWDTIFLLLHYYPNGLTNKQLRTLSEEIGKPIKFSWFDTEFHRRENEGLVMSKRNPGQREALYFLTQPGKKRAGDLIRTLQTKSEQETGGKRS